MLWASEKISTNENGMGVLKLFTDQNLSLSFCPFVVFFFFLSGDVVNKIPTCGVVLISNSSVCDVYVFQAAVSGGKKYRSVTKVVMKDISSPLTVAWYLIPRGVHIAPITFSCVFDNVFVAKKVSQIRTSLLDNVFERTSG